MSTTAVRKEPSRQIVFVPSSLNQNDCATGCQSRIRGRREPFVQALTSCFATRFSGIFQRVVDYQEVRSATSERPPLPTAKYEPLGTVRELISRTLGRLQAEGFLEVDGRKIVVKDLEGLKNEQSANE